ncbi:MAG: hypothetical protein C5B59_11975 [Bacteroidetes bacterium]|nr:MAG: hypothetical protein C5B59_11975 [Bacteroidota bacterium]
MVDKGKRNEAKWQPATFAYLRFPLSTMPYEILYFFILNKLFISPYRLVQLSFLTGTPLPW